MGEEARRGLFGALGRPGGRVRPAEAPGPWTCQLSSSWSCPQLRETFRNGRPDKWGEGVIEIDGDEFSRQAPVHPRTNLPLGEGCRWERQTLDQMDFPVYALFMP